MDENLLVAKLPQYTKSILNALNAAGYEAYVVGGAVRDLLLGREPDDYDITTNARPEQVLALCQAKSWHTVDQLGQNFGCVMIVLDGIATEVTTFRGERYDESDAHRPVATWYCDSLREDLSRRDFTVNAMALDIHGQVFDYHGGKADLARHLIRPVGKATIRYQEDALRMLRACRFDIIEALGLGCETVVENADIPSALEYAYNKFDQDYHQSASQVLEAFKDSEDSSFMASLNWEMDLRANFMIPARGYQSLYFERYTFLGGAHGQGQKGALCYKLASGERVKLDNLFTEGSREILSERLSDALVRQAEQEGFLDALFTRQAPASESFYICEDGICFIYGQYQLGPYYLGCLEIMLSWDEVSDILKQ